MKIYKVKVNGKTYEVQLESVDEVKTESATSSETKTKEAPKKETSKKASSSSSTNLVEVVAPIQGNVIDVKVKVGDKVLRIDNVSDIRKFVENKTAWGKIWRY